MGANEFMGIVPALLRNGDYYELSVVEGTSVEAILGELDNNVQQAAGDHSLENEEDFIKIETVLLPFYE